MSVSCTAKLCATVPPFVTVIVLSTGAEIIDGSIVNSDSVTLVPVPPMAATSLASLLLLFALAATPIAPNASRSEDQGEDPGTESEDLTIVAPKAWHGLWAGFVGCGSIVGDGVGPRSQGRRSRPRGREDPSIGMAGVTHSSGRSRREDATMEILVTESAPGAATSAAERLVAAGHRPPAWCRCPGRPRSRAPASPGRARSRPTPIDAVLTVREHVRTTPALTEDGVTCALRRHVPVAVTGRSVLNPFGALGATVIDEGDVVGGCERVAAASRVAHEAVAVEVVRATLAVAGCPGSNSAASPCGAPAAGSGCR